MVSCAVCNRLLGDDPNEVEDVISCRFCEAVVCSEECAASHEEREHAGDAIALRQDEDERR